MTPTNLIIALKLISLVMVRIKAPKRLIKATPPHLAKV